MGVIHHHALIATTWNQEDVAALRGYILTLRDEAQRRCVLIDATINGYTTFFLAPDGSKEGWDDSDAGDKDRDTIIAWLKTRAYSDGSNCWKWVEVGFGELGVRVHRRKR